MEAQKRCDMARSHGESGAGLGLVADSSAKALSTLWALLEYWVLQFALFLALLLRNLQPAIPQALSCGSNHPEFSKALLWCQALRKSGLGFSQVFSNHSTSCSAPHHAEPCGSLRRRKNTWPICVYQDIFLHFKSSKSMSKTSAIKTKTKNLVYTQRLVISGLFAHHLIITNPPHMPTQEDATATQVQEPSADGK